MRKNVLIITGSPRDKKYTNKLANAFARGAEKKGHDVVIFNASKKKVNNCIACDNCWSNGKACVFKNDHFNELSGHIEWADLILFATPLYWYTYSGQIKSAIDKLYSISPSIAQKDMTNKASILISCGEDADESIFDGLKLSFEKMNATLNWAVEDMITISDINNVDIEEVLSDLEYRAQKI